MTAKLCGKIQFVSDNNKIKFGENDISDEKKEVFYSENKVLLDFVAKLLAAYLKNFDAESVHLLTLELNRRCKAANLALLEELQKMQAERAEQASVEPEYDA